METDEEVLDRYIRTKTEPFGFAQMYASVSGELQSMDEEDCLSYLLSSSSVFSCADGTFVTYAGAFTGKYFCILPTRAEIEQGIFVAGSRCVPFADNAMLAHLLSFRYDGKTLEMKTGRFISADAVDMFAMFGVELAPQCIAIDPANSGLDIADNDYTLPPKVSLTGVCVPEQLAVGDRLICRVADWDKGVIDIVSIEHTAVLEISDADIKRQEWYDILENGLLECFDRDGPLGSIGEQLSLVFINNADALCIPECGTVSECVAQSRKVDFASYGVETRLWKAKEVVPVVGKWNEGSDGMGRGVLSGFLLTADFVIEALLTDQLHKKVEAPEEILQAMLPPGTVLSQEESDTLLLHIKNMYATLQKDYNWFADAPLAPLREKALALYQEAREVAFAMYAGNVPLGDYSQQALVVYLQVFGNVQKTLCLIQKQPEYALSTVDEDSRTLDNMRDEFESAQSLLMKTVQEDDSNEDDFVVIKGTDHKK